MAVYLTSYDTNDFQAEFKIALNQLNWYASQRDGEKIRHMPETTLYHRGFATLQEAIASFRAAESAVRKEHPTFLVTREVIAPTTDFHWIDRRETVAKKK